MEAVARLGLAGQCTLAALALLFSAAVRLAAQDAPSAGRVAVPEARYDSLRWRHRARDAQARLEAVRLATLSVSGAPPGAPCAEVVGRFCLWRDDEAERQWRPPPEPERVTEARDEFLRVADSAAAHIPGDPWIAGQRVRYLSEAGQDEMAFAAARRCAAAASWCGFLAGFALHQARRYVEADSAFSRALSLSSDSERRAWSDLSPLLGPADRRRYRSTPLSERDSLEQRFWWLADPLYLVPGNDRRTEQLARLVMAALQEGARTPDGAAWGRDSREILLRNGWPRGWERMASAGPASDASVVSHTAPDSPRLLPPWRAVRSLAALGARGWPLRDEKLQSEYVPPYAVTSSQLSYQLARFPRGDSMEVVAVLDLAAVQTSRMPASDSSTSGEPPGDTVEAGLIISANERASPGVARARLDAAARTVALALKVRDTDAVVSAEVLRRRARQAKRSRGWLPALSSAGATRILSDLLLFSPGDSLPSSLSGALALAPPVPRAVPGGTVGIYWELAMRERGPVEMTLTLATQRRGAARRLAEVLRLRRAPVALRMRWVDGAPQSGVASRSLVVRLPAGLAPGDYTLRLVAAGAERAAEAPLRISR